MFLYDKSNNLVNISNSLLYYFTKEKFNETSKELDKILNKKEYKKVVVMLFDGLGESMRDKHLSKNDFLRKKEKFNITSVFPPTTVAATTAFLSAKYPNQTGWLGWQQYFKQHDVVVEMFTNVNPVNRQSYSPKHLSSLYCSYENIVELINQNSNTKASSLYPDSIARNNVKTLTDFFTKADEMMKEDSSHFIYMYWPEPDSLIHQYGTNHQCVKRNIKEINKKIYQLAKSNKDNLIIVLADHSLVDTKFFYTFEHDDFKDCLKTITSLDSRSCFFHVKHDKINDFSTIFNKYYGEYFTLKTKEEVIKEKIFGEGGNHPLFEDFLGDFLASSTSEYAFDNFDTAPYIGAHAGSLKEESIISVSIINE
jgi:hypothetical protein